MSAPSSLDEALLLDNQLCFMVYRLHRGITDLYRPVLAGLGLTYPQYLVMLALWEDEPMTVSRLGERLSLDSGTLSPLLKRLEAAGLVERARSQADERSVEVSLTRAGRALRRRAREVPTTVGRCLAASAADYGRLRDQLAAMLARVEDSLMAEGDS
jgi:DNA-binding MarR family transcriptional regulator